MLKTLSTVALLSLAFTTSAGATPGLNATTYDAKAACERYAQEDQIKPEHMTDYMTQCLRDLSNDQPMEQDMEMPTLDEKPAGAKDAESGKAKKP